MALEISPLKDTELDVYIDIAWKAFASASDSYSPCFYHGGFSEPVQAYLRDSTKEQLSDPSHSFILVRDSNTRNVLAIACWYFQPADKSMQEVLDDEEEAREKRAEQEPIPGIHFAAINDCRQVHAELKRNILRGKAHALLQLLATHPSAQRRGAGAAALAWGLQKADQKGLPAYLEASGMGKPLYAKFGFKEVRASTVELPDQAYGACLR